MRINLLKHFEALHCMEGDIVVTFTGRLPGKENIYNISIFYFLPGVALTSTYIRCLEFNKEGKPSPTKTALFSRVSTVS